MQRYDYYTLPKATKTDEGFIKDTPIIGRVGLLTYYNADGTKRIEYRPPEEAFNADSLASISGKPITMGHVAMVNSRNAKKVQPIGSVLSGARQDGNNIIADVIIYDELPPDKRELSCGYSVDLDETPGTTPEGEHYDAIQRNIKYNHLAVVAKGRAGNARLNLDAAGEQTFIHDVDDTRKDSTRMSKLRLDTGIEYEVPPEVKAAYDALESKNTDLQKAKDIAEAEKDVAKEETKKAKDALEQAKKENKDNFDAAVSERIDMLTVATKHGIENAEKLDSADIKKEVIKKVHGNVNLDGKSDDYIQAMYDLAKDKTDSADEKAQKQRKDMTDGIEGRADDSDVIDTQEAALAKLKADEAELYRKTK